MNLCYLKCLKYELNSQHRKMTKLFLIYRTFKIHLAVFCAYDDSERQVLPFTKNVCRDRGSMKILCVRLYFVLWNNNEQLNYVASNKFITTSTF